MNVKVAYDTRRGNPFVKYRDFDFKLNRDPIKIEDSNIRIRKKGLNILQFTAYSNDFEVVVSGFDRQRDLKINVR